MQFIRFILDIFRQWQQHQQGRREIAALSETQLKDVGLTRLQVMQELARPFRPRKR